MNTKFEEPGWDINMNFDKKMEEQMDSIEIQMGQLAKKYVEAFHVNPYGKEVLNHLGEMFSHEATWTTGMTFEHTTYMEGQRSVLTYINKLLNYSYEPKKHE